MGEKWECVRQQRREEIGGGEQGEGGMYEKSNMEAVSPYVK